MLNEITNNLKNIRNVFMSSNYKNKDIYTKYITDTLDFIFKQSLKLEDLEKLKSEYIKVIEKARLEERTNDIRNLENKLEIQRYKIKNITNIIIAISGYFIALLIASSIAMSLIKLLIWIINI